MNRPVASLAPHLTDILHRRAALASKLPALSSVSASKSQDGSRYHDEDHDDSHYSILPFASVRAIGEDPMRMRRPPCMMTTTVLGNSLTIDRRSQSLTSWALGGPPTGAVAFSLIRRYFSVGSNSDNGNGTRKDGQDHHAFFQEQLRELEQERTSFFATDGAHPDVGPKMEANVDLANSVGTASVSTTATSSQSESFSFSSQLDDWREEQTMVFGRQLHDHDPASSAASAPQEHEQDHQQQDDADGWEDMKEEREILYQFTSEERIAWGNQPNAASLQQVLAEVAKARRMATAADNEKSEPRGANDGNNIAVPDNDGTKSNVISSSTIDGTLPPAPNMQRHQSFSHVTEDGNSIHMVDVGGKAVTARMAHAQSKVILPQSVLEAFGLMGSSSSSSPSTMEEMVGPKGPIFTTAKLAGIMAAKRTSDLIPLCHPLPLDQVQIDIRLDRYRPASDGTNNDDSLDTIISGGGGVVTIDCTCRVTHRTGVEMEALTGATVAALTVYDMTKAVSHEIEITGTKLMAKTGGKRIVLPPVEQIDN